MLIEYSWPFRALICLDHWEIISVCVWAFVYVYRLISKHCSDSTLSLLFLVCDQGTFYFSITHCHNLNDLFCLEGEYIEFPIDMFQQCVNDCLTALNNIWGRFLTTLQNSFSLHWAVQCNSPKLDTSWNLQKLKWVLPHKFSIFSVKSVLY